MVSGLAPGRLALTDDGRKVDLRQRRDRQEEEGRVPASASPSVSSVVATGRRMKAAERFTAGSGQRIAAPACAARMRAGAAASRSNRGRSPAW